MLMLLIIIVILIMLMQVQYDGTTDVTKQEAVTDKDKMGVMVTDKDKMGVMVTDKDKMGVMVTDKDKMGEVVVTDKDKDTQISKLVITKIKTALSFQTFFIVLFIIIIGFGILRVRNYFLVSSQNTVKEEKDPSNPNQNFTVKEEKDPSNPNQNFTVKEEKDPSNPNQNFTVKEEKDYLSCYMNYYKIPQTWQFQSLNPNEYKKLFTETLCTRVLFHPSYTHIPLSPDAIMSVLSIKENLRFLYCHYVFHDYALLSFWYNDRVCMCKIYLPRGLGEKIQGYKYPPFSEENKLLAPGRLGQEDHTAIITERQFYNRVKDDRVKVIGYNLKVRWLEEVKMTLCDYIKCFFAYTHEQNDFQKTVHEFNAFLAQLRTELLQCFTNHCTTYNAFPRTYDNTGRRNQIYWGINLETKSICITHTNKLFLIDVGNPIQKTDDVDSMINISIREIMYDIYKTLVSQYMPCFAAANKNRNDFDTYTSQRGCSQEKYSTLMQNCADLGSNLNLQKYFELIELNYTDDKYTQRNGYRGYKETRPWFAEKGPGLLNYYTYLN
jgi:hypothetical protein